MNYDTSLYVENLQKILSEPLCIQGNPQYLDISSSQLIEDELLREAKDQVPPSDPLIKALGLILESMEKGPFDLTRFGINELLKSYLFKVNEENQEYCTMCYLNCIYQIYLYGLMEYYPFTDLLWEYLSLCFHAMGIYLVDHKLDKGCHVFLNKVSTMGKLAAQKGLHTSSIQHFLHNLEIRANESGFPDLADNAKNHRFNLETF